MSKGQKFLKVTSILMIIGGALAGVSCAFWVLRAWRCWRPWRTAMQRH